MSEESDDTNAKALALSLHGRLVAGDVTASAEIAEAYLPLIVQRLKRAYPEIQNPHDWETAAEDALLSYLKRPEQFNPDHLSLMSYLVMSAKGDLLNLLHPKKIDENTRTSADIVELEGSDAEQEADEMIFISPPDRTERSDPYLWEKVRALLPDPRDQCVISMMIHGIRDTDAYAAVLGIAHLNREEQELEVKRVKDRLKKRLQRHLDLPEYHNE